MKRLLLALSALLVTFCMNAQDEVEKIVLELSEEKVFDVVEEMPLFPGGPSALFDYLSKNIQYPKEAEAKGIVGRAIVVFVVEKDGSITNAKVVNNVEPSLGKEALRVILAMPNWIPGKQNGKLVRVKYTVPVNFKL